jgi:hypothetical protein
MADDGTIDVSTGAQGAIKSAMDALQPYSSEPRVAGLLSKLNAIANPEDIRGEDETQLAKSIADCEKIAKSEDASPHLRERAENVGHELQRAYLRKVSPAGSETWEAAAKRAGRAA